MAKRTQIIRRWMTSMGRPLPTPTPIFEDNQATIAQVLKDRLTPNIKHLDIPVTYLHELYIRGVFCCPYTDSSMNWADLNSKPHGGTQLLNKTLWMIGERFYPPPNSEHFKLLQLEEYNIGSHKGSFLRTQPSPNENTTQKSKNET